MQCDKDLHDSKILKYDHGGKEFQRYDKVLQFNLSCMHACMS